MNTDKVAYPVFTTLDYGKFKSIEGNREVLEDRKKKIRKSVEKHGWLKSPILVNQYFQIIDGQARFFVRMEENLPIEYIMEPNAGIDECIALNLWSTAWTKQNYIDGEIIRGNENYKRLMEVCEQFPKLRQNIILGVIDNVTVAGGRGNYVKTGDLVFTEERRKEIEKSLKFVSDNYGIIKGIQGQTRTLATLIAWVINNTNVDVKRLGDVLHEKQQLMAPCIRTDKSLRELEGIYNNGLPAKKKIYFENEYRRYVDSKTTANNRKRVSKKK